MDQQASERAAIVNFMGRIFGEARQLDRDMIQPSSTLQPTSHRAEQALKSYLQAQQSAFIPPAPQEIASAGGTPPPLPEYTPSPPPVMPSFTPVEQIPDHIPVSVQPAPVYAPPVPQNNESFVEISRKLDIIIGQLERLIMLSNSRSIPLVENVKLYENTVQQKSISELPGSDTEG